MSIIAGFIPFVAFALLDHPLGTTAALSLAALAAGISLVRERLRGKSTKLLHVGAFVMFGALAAVTLAIGSTGGVLAVRAQVDAGILVIVAGSLVLGRPFTLDYAKETVPERVWGTSRFLRTNQLISAVWAAAFAAILGADLAMLYACPMWLGIAVNGVALLVAAYATKVIPQRAKLALEAAS